MTDMNAEIGVEITGANKDGWYTTRLHDWIGICPELRDADVRGYVILRSLVIDKFEQRVRKLTLAILCELIPGPNGKPSSPTRVRGILANLSAVGLVTTPEGGPIKTSSRTSAAQKVIRIQINDRPAGKYTGWRNTEAALEAAAKKVPTATKDTSEAGRKNDPRGRKNDPDSRPDLRKPDRPLVSSLGPSLSPDAADQQQSGGAEAKDEREKKQQDQAQHPQAEEAAAFVAGLPGGLGRTSVRELTPLVLQAFADGWSGSDLRDHLKKRVDVTRVHNPASVYRKHLNDLPDVPRQRGGQGRVAGPKMCERHSWSLANDCSACRAAARDRSEPAGINEMARQLLASLDSHK